MKYLGPNRIRTYLQPGEAVFGGPRHVFTTLLGSCVSITLWHPQRRCGALSHFLLPTRGGPNGQLLDARYGDEAVRLMLSAFSRNGIDPSACVAKIFGGGRMFQGMADVGKRNGEAARSMLESHGIQVASEDLFGAGHRKIIFDVESGDVWVRQLRLAEVALQEER